MSGVQHAVVTPEGAELAFTNGGLVERAIAFCIDAIVLVVAVLLLGLALGAVFGPAMWFLLVFLARTFYFAWFETRHNGSTIGKRIMRLRVIRADGGPLSTEVVLARNFTREVELFLPLQILLMPNAFRGEHAGALPLIGSLWVLLLLLFPLCNRHRLRIGDLLAGTRVVVSPKVALLRDLAAETAADRSPYRDPEPGFTEAHLAVYGIKELEVLEDVLRRARAPGGKETLDAVAKSIKKRIGWSDAAGAAPPDYVFLRAFYAAQRRHLEHRLLLGHRRERKRS